MKTIRFVPLPANVAAHYRAEGLDANGQPPERQIAAGGGNPCRACLEMIADGEEMLILGHRPFPEPQPYAEVGPIFLHAKVCIAQVADDSAEIPPFLESPHYIVRGYGADNRIIYGTGQIVQTDEIPTIAAELFQQDEIVYLHVRSASNNCFHCRVERS